MGALLSPRVRLTVGALAVLASAPTISAHWAAPPSGSPPQESALAERERIFQILDTAPARLSFSPRRGPYNPLTIVRIVNALQALGTKRALSILTAYIQPEPSIADGGMGSDARLAHQGIGLAIAMRALFDPPKDPGYMPSLGTAWTPAPKDPREYPLFPVVLAGDLPILAVGDNPDTLPPDAVREQLAYYRANCEVRQQPLNPTSRPLDLINRFASASNDVRDVVWIQLAAVEETLYPDPKDQHYTPDQKLIIAAESGDVAQVRELLNHGANANARSAYGDTALCLSCAGSRGGKDNRADICKLLLDHGADARAASDDGTTPLVAAAGSGNDSAVQLLLRHKASATTVAPGVESPVIAAARSGSVQTLRTLLEHGGSSQAADKDGQTPILAAAASGNAETVKLLLSRGANIRDRDAQGNTVLHAAVQWRFDRDVVRCLLENGADVNARTVAGETPLMLAVRWAWAHPGMAEVVKLLVTHGADLNARSNSGETALDAALRSPDQSAEHSEIVKLLMDRGAVTGPPTGDNETAISRAASLACQQSDALPVLLKALEHPADIDKPLLNDQTVLMRTVGWALEVVSPASIDPTAHDRKLTVIEALLKHGANPNLYDKLTGGTPLIVAAQRRNVALMEMLLKHGANPNLPRRSSREGDRPLLTELIFGRDVPAAEVLLKYGAKPNVTDPITRLTPLMIAAESDNVEMVQALLKHGADPLVRRDDRDHLNAVELARRRQASKVLPILEDATAKALLKRAASNK